MNLGLKLMLFSLVAMIALPMFMIKPDGKPMMTLDDWLPDTKAISKTVSKARNTFHNATSGEPPLEDVALRSTGKMYSWKDERGVMHFSEEPPPVSAQQVKVRDLPKEVNVMQAVKPRTKPSSGSAGEEQGFKMSFPTTVPLKEIPKLVENAKQLQALADQRGAALEGL